MKILVTGAAGFIGFYLALNLLKLNHEVVGLDNINDYYDVNLKYARLRELGVIKSDIKSNKLIQSNNYKNFKFIKLNLEEDKAISDLFNDEKFDVVVNLAAQAGVRYSIENPRTYIDSNIVGFLNILEACRYNNVKHLVYASSSSVYGLNEKIPFSTEDKTDTPISLYAASKKANELMAHTYSHLFNIPSTGLRFFTVYGPWGRPDMALFKFTKSILEGSEIEVYNNGDMSRDFTYVDDIVEGITRIVSKPIENSKRYAKVYNIGNGSPVRLLDFVKSIEKHCKKTANIVFKPLQPGDVKTTFADTRELFKDYGFKPNTSIDEGIAQFVRWYRQYYNV